jgi:hypothetical protein
MSPAAIARLWTADGGPASAAANMARIAMAESADRPGAVQTGQPPGLTGYGLLKFAIATSRAKRLQGVVE